MAELTLAAAADSFVADELVEAERWFDKVGLIAWCRIDTLFANLSNPDRTGIVDADEAIANRLCRFNDGGSE